MVETPTIVPCGRNGPFHLSSAGRTHAGACRTLNEDAFFLDDALGVWAVADGMGGHDGGDRASAVVVESLSEMRRHDDAHEMLLQLRNRIQAAHTQLRTEARVRGVATMGSTVTAFMQAGTRSVFAWAGDSRGFLVRDGALEQITTDHSLVQDLVAAGRLSPDDAETHPDAHVLTRAVGASDRLDLDFRQRKLLQGDRCLLCSDGLTCCVPSPEIRDVLTSDRRPEAICDRLVQAALANGAPDNVTAVVVAFD